MNNIINSKSTTLIFFTICSRNFLAQAQVLHNRVTRYHPYSLFYLVLCDDMDGVDFSLFPFEVISIYDLGIPSLQELANRYNITELNTSLKPFAFLSIFERHNGASVIYLDPDIMVTSPFEEVVDLLNEQNYDCVLTPHVCEPAEFAEMDDSKMLQYGIYNLGFCALNDTDEVRRVVSWWGRRLEKFCIIDLHSGFFVDQKWADLLPAFIERTAILRHPGYNVAYWNLSQRTVYKDRSAGGEPVWLVNSKPLRFFHFSGSVVDEPIIFSRHSQQFTLESLRDVEMLFRAYVDETNKHGRKMYRKMSYSFSWNGQTGINLHTPNMVDDDTQTQD